jgi:hypothetical protein
VLIIDRASEFFIRVEHTQGCVGLLIPFLLGSYKLERLYLETRLLLLMVQLK